MHMDALFQSIKVKNDETKWNSWEN
jgi:hypothetical protein